MTKILRTGGLAIMGTILILALSACVKNDDTGKTTGSDTETRTTSDQTPNTGNDLGTEALVTPDTNDDESTASDSETATEADDTTAEEETSTVPTEATESTGNIEQDLTDIDNLFNSVSDDDFSEDDLTDDQVGI